MYPKKSATSPNKSAVAKKIKPYKMNTKDIRAVVLALLDLLINLKSFLKKVDISPNRFKNSRLSCFASITFFLSPVSIKKPFLKKFITLAYEKISREKGIITNNLVV